jgi:hypothetical protein
VASLVCAVFVGISVSHRWFLGVTLLQVLNLGGSVPILRFPYPP